MSLVLMLYLSILQTEEIRQSWTSQRYFAIDNGNWYRGEDNLVANLAWGESYVMAGLASWLGLPELLLVGPTGMARRCCASQCVTTNVELRLSRYKYHLLAKPQLSTRQ